MGPFSLCDDWQKISDEIPGDWQTIDQSQDISMDSKSKQIWHLMEAISLVKARVKALEDQLNIAHNRIDQLEATNHRPFSFYNCDCLSMYCMKFSSITPIRKSCMLSCSDVSSPE